MSSVIFDGHDLSELFIIGDPSIKVFGHRVTYDQSDNRNGSVVLGRVWDSGTLDFFAVCVGRAETCRDKWSILAAWLDVDEPKKLVLPDTPERYYMAIPDGDVEPERYLNGERARLAFTLTDPIAYGRERTVTVPSGGSVTFTVEGTAPTKPIITANAKRDSSSQVWGVRLDEGDFVHVVTGAAAARSVVLDCDERTLVLNGSAAIPTLDSDWLEFTPGQHTLRMDNGTGAATVRFTERWR